MSDSECYPKANFFRKPNFPTFANCGFNTRHDNREVTLIEFFESQICPNIYLMFRSVDWTHDMIIVKVTLIHFDSFDTSANFALWQMRHRFNPRKRVNDYQRFSMLTVLPLRSMSCTLGNSSSLQAAGDDHSWWYYDWLSAKKDILEIFLCI